MISVYEGRKRCETKRKRSFLKALSFYFRVVKSPNFVLLSTMGLFCEISSAKLVYIYVQPGLALHSSQLFHQILLTRPTAISFNSLPHNQEV